MHLIYLKLCPGCMLFYVSDPFPSVGCIFYRKYILLLGLLEKIQISLIFSFYVHFSLKFKLMGVVFKRLKNLLARVYMYNVCVYVCLHVRP